MSIPFHLRLFALVLCVWLGVAANVEATSNRAYGSEEYATVVDGTSPDGRYAIAAHGEGSLGYRNFHLYLVNAKTGKKIGPLEEIREVLDTNADAYYAKWSKASDTVAITYREDRHKAVMVSYRIRNGRASRISGPVRVAGLPRG